jgi:hypothetical protein
MRSPPAPTASTSNPGRPAITPEVRTVEVRNREGELVRKASQEQAYRIVAQDHGEWAQASNGRWHVKLKSISAGERSSGGEWMRRAVVVRERLKHDVPGRELLPMFSFVDSQQKSKRGN